MLPIMGSALVCRRLVRGPDKSKTFEETLHVAGKRGRFTLWPMGIPARNEPRPEPPMMEWRYDAVKRERVVTHSTMPAWWREPSNLAALCAAWEKMVPANPLPLGWKEEKRAPTPPTAIAAE